MNTNLDKETQRAWKGWVFFTRAVTWAGVAAAVVLGLMALALL